MPRLESSPPPIHASGHGHSSRHISGEGGSIFDFRTWIPRLRALPREILYRYRKLGRKSKITIWSLVALHIVILAIVLIITPTRIGQWFNSLGLKLRSMGWKGMILCCLINILSSHPPMFGFMGSLTLMGFTYGVWPGFLLAFVSSMIGAGLAFLSIRTFFLGLFKKNDKWDAFAHVMRNKGLPLIVMIRWCPLPWNIGNALFASVESVKFWQFMVANLAIQPRLMIPVFIGSRLTSLASDEGHDPLRFWLNMLSIALSATISVGTGYWIYRLTLDQMRKLDNGNGDIGEGELAAEAFEDGALLGDYSDSGENGEEEAEMLTTSNANTHGKKESKGLQTQGMIRRTSGSDMGDNIV